MTFFIYLLAYCLCISSNYHLSTVLAVDPTQGFVSLPFNESYYRIQKPYDVPEDQRYSFNDGTHSCWVYSTDKPHTPTSHTKPRTEIAIEVIMHAFTKQRSIFILMDYFFFISFYKINVYILHYHINLSLV